MFEFKTSNFWRGYGLAGSGKLIDTKVFVDKEMAAVWGEDWLERLTSTPEPEQEKGITIDFGAIKKHINEQLI